MSSRRKSRPVRRIESEGVVHSGYPSSVPYATEPLYNQNIESETHSEHNTLDEYHNSEIQNDALEAYSNGAAIENNHHIDNNADIKPAKLHAGDNPPEGVYVLQPQGFSDDEGTDQEHDVEGQVDRKRMRDGEHSGTENEERRTGGLDLTVKRRRTDSNDDDQQDNEDAADSALAGNKMQRFEMLLQLLALRRPLAEAMSEVGISRDEVAALHRAKLQMIESKRQDMLSNTETTNEFEQISSEPQQQRNTEDKEMENWHNNRSNEGNTFEATVPANQGILKQFHSNIPPAAVAAMMATLVSNSEQARERTDALQKIFNRSQNYFTQSPSMTQSNTPPTGSYATNADSMDSITAGTVSSGVGSIKKGTIDPTNFDEDVFDKYISKYSSKNSCMQASCPHINRDHFHCTDSDCNFQRFTNKSDVIRHYNMHKKRDNSLAHGFMRFAPTDDCIQQFGACHLNGKSTHYHCLYSNCTKVYTSTSDVMTHENFHKKNQQFVSNGFQRFRATESCCMRECPFLTQRTTHFHCTRPDCNFTFKNKCDIEKHKAYHMRDDAYARQGFKKFYKNETCKFQACTWNRTANHFHCLRRNCDFAFTSTSQMVSHKRKHDRQDMIGGEPISGMTPTTATTTPTSISVFPRATVSLAPNVTPVNSFVRSPSLIPTVAPNNRPPNFILPFFSPFVAASFLNRPMAPSLFEHRNGGITSAFQEAAKKVLASIPSSVAAALPRTLATSYSPKTTGQYQAYLPNSASISPTLPGQESSYPRREEQSNETSTSPGVMSTHSNNSYDRPPPTYVEAVEHKPTSSSPHYERCNTDQANYQDNWRDSPVEESSDQQAEAMEYYEQDSTQQQADVDQALNLSSRSGSSNDNYRDSNQNDESNQCGMQIPDTPSQAVLKFFRGLGPDECRINSCVFHNQHHFHCAVQDCCAVFTEKISVLNHTRFHETMEQAGIQQHISSDFPVYPTPKTTKGCNPDTSSPPPGYIALPVTKRQESRSEPAAPSTPTSQIPPHSIVLSRGPVNVSATTPIDTVAEERKKSMYEYISKIVTEKNPPNFFQNYPRSGEASGTMAMLHNSILASIVNSQGAMAANTTTPITSERPVSGTPTEMQADTAKHLNPYSDEGFLHIRQGMSCTRPDCKYMNQNHWHCTLNRCRYVCKSLAKAQSHRQAHDSLEGYARSAKEWFCSYTTKKNCPNPNCELRLRGHYHCLKPGCQFVTIGTSKLPWHMKKHEKIARREASGFKYYTKKEQCGKFGCKYNSMFSHYHCIRADCEFAFQYKHQMSTHVRKHLRRMLGRSYHGRDMHTNSAVADIDHSNVDSGDDSLPLIVDEADEIEQRPGDALVTEKDSMHKHVNHPELTQQQLAMLEQISRGGGMNRPHDGANESIPPESNNEESFTYDDDDSSSDEILDLTAGTTPHDVDSNSMGSSSNNEYTIDMGNTADDESHVQHAEQSVSNASGNAESQLMKQTDQQSSGSGPVFTKFRLNNDVMDGFKRFESIENCGDQLCTFMFKVAHFHCIREDCNYRFTGRTHMFKHHQHHERVAGLVRDDFKRFKTSQDCLFEGCLYKGNSTHFHCLRCQFKCTDSAKVGTHRRQHMKADTLEQSGFERFRGKEDCMRENCKYREKTTSHFHCLQEGCSYTVVGLSGIEQHANKHKRSNILAQVCSTMSQEQKYKTLSHPQVHPYAPSQGRTDTYAPTFVPPLPFSTASSSPVTDDRSSMSPATMHFDPRYLQVQSTGGAMELPVSLNLAVNQQERAGVATTSLSSVPAGVGTI